MMMKQLAKAMKYVQDHSIGDPTRPRARFWGVIRAYPRWGADGRGGAGRGRRGQGVGRLRDRRGDEVRFG